MTSALEAQGVQLAGRLAQTDLSLASNTLTAVIGPNGSGKTSLLRCLAGVERQAGAVRINGERLDTTPPRRRRQLIGFLPASREVAWAIAARNVIALGLDHGHHTRVHKLITALGLTSLADRSVDRLSTGERARVLLARALAPRPHVLLLDEPLSNLDPAWVLRILALLRSAADDGAAVLVSLHDLSLLDHFDRALLIGGGAVRADESPQSLLAKGEIKTWFEVEPTQSGWRLV